MPLSSPFAPPTVASAQPRRHGHPLAWLAVASAVALGGWPGVSRSADEPVDVPITRGTIDLSGLRPALALPGAPAGTATNDTPQAPPPPAAPARPKPRTVAEFAAEARAKAAAEAAAKAAAPAPSSATAPNLPAAPLAAETRPVQRTEAPMAASTAKEPEKMPAQAPERAPASAPAKAVAKTSPKAPSPAPGPAPGEGLDKVAVKLVEAMARASARQAERESTEGKKPPPALGSREDIRTRAAAVAGGQPTSPHAAVPWGYSGPGGPEHWAQLKPEYSTCGAGSRQSPIAIDTGTTLQGPAEPIAFDYRPAEGSVVHTGYTVQVEVAPTHSMGVRGSRYVLQHIALHHPGEHTVDGTTLPLSAHLVHRNADGQQAVVAIQFTPGEANPAVDTIGKYLPLDHGDRVPLPAGLLNLAELLPTDQRYYQYLGSLTTPPCTEGVLWLVLKTPVTVSPAQIRLFGQLFPLNARPAQPLNGRPVREAL